MGVISDEEELKALGYRCYRRSVSGFDFICHTLAQSLLVGPAPSEMLSDQEDPFSDSAPKAAVDLCPDTPSCL